MVEQFTDFFSQVGRFVQHHVPLEQCPRPDVGGFGLLVAGIILSVLGAKLARPVVTLGFGAAGAAAALVFGRALDFPMAACVVVGVLAAAVFGYALFRLWVGIGAAVLLATVAVSVFGSQRIVPHLATFEEGRYVTTDSYVIPDVPLEERRPWESLRSTSWEFWSHVRTQDAGVERKTLLIAATAGLVGLALGAFAVRFSLVVLTALVGTSLVASAIGVVLHYYHPEAFLAVQNSPRVVGGAILGFLGASLLLQMLLTRRLPESKSAAE